MNLKLHNRVLRQAFATMVLWGMIPLTLLASRPFMGCVCADGHMQILCPQVFAEKTAKLPPCCRAAAERTCCCSREATSSDKSGVKRGSGCRCRLVANSATLIADSQAKPTSVLAVTPFNAHVENSFLVLTSLLNKPGNAEILGPPPDLVVLLCHFVI